MALKVPLLTIDMAFTKTLIVVSSYSPVAIAILLCTSLFFLVLYRLFLHPLSLVPGPLLSRISSVYLYTISYLGIECRVLAHHHRKYRTSVLRIAPDAVSLSNGAALNAIYVAGGGFQKDWRYRNFNTHGHATIFSTRDTAYRDVRAKAVLPLFAMSKIKAAGKAQGVIRACVDDFVERFQREKANALRFSPDLAKVNIVALAERMTIDATTGYLFKKRYGGLDEQADLLAQTGVSASSSSKVGMMSATPFMLAVLAAGRFSLLPNWLFLSLNAVLGFLFPDPETNRSFNLVNSFAASLIADANPDKDDTYQSRLLAAGISRAETIAQTVAVTFAGTDSTAVNLATLIFHLVQNPSVRKRLERELEGYKMDPSWDPQTLPYLRAVIREGMRLAVANPARLSRIVPPGGFDVDGTHLPPGTSVGFAAYVLHHNPELFPEPFAFRPERWLDDDAQTEDGKVNERAERQKREMERDTFPFGVGSRMCIARNLATHVLFLAVSVLVKSGVLEGARTCEEKIELEEWFNAGIKGHKLEIEW